MRPLSIIILLLVFARPAPAEIDCRQRPVSRIAPGTRIPDQAPAAWTHLIFKNHCLLATGDVNELPDFAKDLAEFLFTTIVVRVTRPADTRGAFEIDQVAIGLGTRVGSDDVVISSMKYREFGAELGPIKRVLLSRAEQRLARVIQVAASKDMTVIDAPTIMKIGSVHQGVVIRYLILVNRRSGQPVVLAWLIGLGDGDMYKSVSREVIRVQPNLVATAQLHVDKTHIHFGIPDPEAFALTNMPPGTRQEMPRDLRKLAVKQQLTPSQASHLEFGFRRLLSVQ